VILKKILNSELFKNTSILVSGTILAQLIPILLQPVLRRYYSPEIFGAYTVYLSLVGILMMVASFKYELAIILPKKNKEAANIFFISVIINFLFNLLLFIVIVIFKPGLLLFLNLSNEFAFFLYLVPAGVFLFNLYQSINYWLIREKKYFAISKNKLVRRGFEGVAQVSLKYTGSSLGLLLGDIFGHCANITYGIYQSIKNGLKLRYFNIKKIRYVLNKYSEYPKYNLFPGLLSASSYLLPAILINKLFNSELAGFFDLSKLVLSIPMALIATSISNVLLERISAKFKKSDTIRKDLFSIAGFVIFIMIIEILIIVLWGENLFKIFFGKQWEYAGAISKILVWSYALNFLVASFSSIFISMKKIKILSLWQFLYFAAILMLFFFKHIAFDQFLKIFVAIEISSYLSIILLMISIVYKYESKLK